MNYTVIRDGQEFGPYSLSELQQYVASGHVLLTDMARSDGMTDAVPVGQIVGNIPVAFAPAASAYTPNLPEYPYPPNLHWALVLLFSVLSCGLFLVVWDIVQAAWMKKVLPTSKALSWYIAALCGQGMIFFFSFYFAFTHNHDHPATTLINLATAVVTLIGRFSLRNSLEEHFNNAEPAGLSLSGVMTFFFGGIYFQYHLNDIVARKHSAMIAGVNA